MKYLLFFIGACSFATSFSQQVAYENLGRVKSIIYKDSSKINYDYDANGNRTSAIINPCFVKPKAVITPSKDTSICAGDSIILKSDSAYSYKWSTGETTRSITVKKTSKDTLIITTINGCTDTAKLTVTVNPLPTITATASANPICQGKTDTLTASGATSYKWSGPNLTDSINPKIVVIPPSGINTYTVTGTTSSCSASKTISVIVNPLPTDISPVAQSETTCAGTSTNIQMPASQSGVSYQLRNNATNALAGTSVSGNGNTINLPTGTLTATTTFNVLATAVSSSCSVAMAVPVTVTVNPLPVITVSAFPNPVCQGSTLTLTANGATAYAWSGPNLNATTGASVTANPATFSTVIYTATGTTNGCSDSAKVPVTVNPGPPITSQPVVAQTLCVNGAPATLTVVANGTGVSYQWYSNTTNTTTGGILINGQTGANYVPPTTTAGTFYYYCIITQPGAVCPTIASNVSSVTILAKPIISVQPLSSQVVCEDNIPAALTVAATGGTGVFSYQWYRNTSNTTTNGVPIFFESLPTFIPSTAFITGTFYYYCIITQSGSGCGTLTSNVSVLTVNARPRGLWMSVSSDPICAGSLLTLIASGAASYVWSGPNLNKTTGATVTATPVTAGKNTYTVVGTSNDCSDSIRYAVTVNLPPTFSTQPLATQNLCLNAIPADLKAAINGSGVFYYQWYRSSSNTMSTGTQINGAVATNYTPPTNISGTFYYYCIVTEFGAVCQTVASNIAQVIVTDTIPKITIEQTSCIEGTVGFSVSKVTGGGTAPQYQWQQRKGATSQWADSIGATGTSFQIAHATNGIQVRLRLTSNAACVKQQVVYSDSSVINVPTDISPVAESLLGICVGGNTNIQIPTSEIGIKYQLRNNNGNTLIGTAVAGTGGTINLPTGALPKTTTFNVLAMNAVSSCTIQLKDSVTIIVNEKPNITVSAIPSSVCQGHLLTLTANGPLETYSWTGPNLTEKSGVSVTANPATIGNATYIATGSNNGCSDSGKATVTVNPALIITMQPQTTQTLCISGIPNRLTVAATGGIGLLSFQWYSNTTRAISGGTKLIGETIDSYTPPISSIARTLYYYCVITQESAICPNTTSVIAEVIFVEKPTFSMQPLNTQSVCINSKAIALTVLASGGTGNFTYQWYTNGLRIIGADSANYDPQTSGYGTTPYYCIASQAGAGCGSIVSGVSIVSVNPFVAPKISILPTCAGAMVSFSSSVTNAGSAPKYQWQKRKDALSTWIDSVGATGSAFSITNTANGIQVRCNLKSNAPCANPATVYSDSVIVNCFVTAISSVISSIDSFSVFPNPNSGTFSIYLKLNVSKVVSFRVFDPTGREVYYIEPKRMGNINIIQVPLKRMASGLYELKMFIDKQNFTIKILVTK